ncbi:MAG: hypothetical protein ACJAVK_000250 [Akkermansiaceae bacterium]|jgi:hypothetical protein
MRKIQMIFITLLSCSCIVAAKEIRVPDDYKTIKDAIAAANTDDVILVGPGIYRERIVLKLRMQVRSAGPKGKGKLCAPLVSGNVCYRNMGGGIGSIWGLESDHRRECLFREFLCWDWP